MQLLHHCSIAASSTCYYLILAFSPNLEAHALDKNMYQTHALAPASAFVYRHNLTSRSTQRQNQLPVSMQSDMQTVKFQQARRMAWLVSFLGTSSWRPTRFHHKWAADPGCRICIIFTSCGAFCGTIGMDHRQVPPDASSSGLPRATATCGLEFQPEFESWCSSTKT